MFAVIIVSCAHWPFLQIQLLFYQSLLLIIYVIYFQPFTTSFFNALEIFNELCILASAYMLLLFTDFQPVPSIQNQVGFIMIAITALNVGVNTVVMIWKTGAKVKLLIRKGIRMWRLRQRKRRNNVKKYEIKVDKLEEKSPGKRGSIMASQSLINAEVMDATCVNLEED